MHVFLHFGQHIYYSDLPNRSARNIELQVAVIIDLLNNNTVEGYKGMYYEPVKMQAYWAWMKDLRLNGVAELYRFNTLAEGFSLYANKTFDPDFTPFFLSCGLFFYCFLNYKYIIISCMDLARAKNCNCRYIHL